MHFSMKICMKRCIWKCLLGSISHTIICASLENPFMVLNKLLGSVLSSLWLKLLLKVFQSKNDHNLFIERSEQHITITDVYVDDIILSSKYVIHHYFEDTPSQYFQYKRPAHLSLFPWHWGWRRGRSQEKRLLIVVLISLRKHLHLSLLILSFKLLWWYSSWTRDL